ncbi:MAG: CZB domain-containing protein [Acidobacteriaceae bacterium]|nr:CZB domain-containing protein [Acidobacteriaceae bacterium]
MLADTYIAKTIECAQDAIASHVRWKIALMLAVRLREPLSPRATQSLQRPEECSIHKWLLSDRTLSLRGTAEYSAALELHQAFHGQMQCVAELINSGQYERAEQILNAPEPFQSASIALANAIMALDRVDPKRPAPHPSPLKEMV